MTTRDVSRSKVPLLRWERNPQDIYYVLIIIIRCDLSSCSSKMKIVLLERCPYFKDVHSLIPPQAIILVSEVVTITVFQGHP